MTAKKPEAERVKRTLKEGSTPYGHHKDGTPYKPPPGFKGVINPVDPETGKVNTPAQIRRRLRRTGKPEDQALLLKSHGMKPIEQWDIDELCEGRTKDPTTGKFVGKSIDTVWMGPILEAEIRRRIPDVSFKSLTGLVPLAIKTLKKLMLNEEVDENGKWVVPAAVKRGAAEYVLDQVIGRALLRIDSTSGSKLQGMLASALVLDDEGTPAHPVIDGQFTDDDPSDTDLEDENDDD